MTQQHKDPIRIKYVRSAEDLTRSLENSSDVEFEFRDTNQLDPEAHYDAIFVRQGKIGRRLNKANPAQLQARIMHLGDTGYDIYVIPHKEPKRR